MHRSTKIRPARHANPGEYERAVPLMGASFAAQRSAEAEIQSLQEDLSGAAQLQYLLNGPREVRRGEFEIACETFPTRHISGDFCTIFDVGDRTVFAIGDIAGKGLVAGMWFTHIVSLVRLHAQLSPDPSHAISGINLELCSLHIERPLITVFLASLDWTTNKLSYCRAGHPPPVKIRAEGGPELAHEGGPVLGVVPDADYEAGSATLRPGDAMLAYSDGLSELHNEQGEEFGMCRLLDEAERCERRSAASLLFCMLGAVKDFAGTAQPHDDLTMMALLRRPAV